MVAKGRDHGGAGRGLHAHDAHVGVDGLGRDRDAGHESAAADGHDDRVAVGELLHHLEADRALAGVDAGVVLEGVEVEHARAVDVVDAEGEGLVVVGAEVHAARAVVADAIGLGLRRAHGHDHRAVADAEGVRGHGDGDAVVSGGDRADAVLHLELGELRDRVEGAADLEALAELLALELEEVLVVVVAQVDGLLERGLANVAGYALARRQDVLGIKPLLHSHPSAPRRPTSLNFVQTNVTHAG